jgi:hypothetical protein
MEEEEKMMRQVVLLEQAWKAGKMTEMLEMLNRPK